MAKRLVFLLIAAGLIGFGAWRQFGAPAVPEADRARCEAIVADLYQSSPETLATMAASCGDAGMVAMMDARKAGDGASEAAASIAAANRSDIVGTLINCALIGAGIGALGAAFGASRRKA